MRRIPTQQQVTWFLDLDNQGKLNLDPPYQRRSVWSLKMRQRFLDTIFNNYPCPSIFLHKVTDDNGLTTHHVIDGKQRLQTILDFAHDKIRLPEDFDNGLAGLVFSEIDIKGRRKFWDYVITVDNMQLLDTSMVSEIFDRLNRNTVKLSQQELRHARFDGWFINEVEDEVRDVFWRKTRISTIMKSRRMRDIQIVSELLMVILEKEIRGFSQSHINDMYATYDSMSSLEPRYTMDEYQGEKDRIKQYILEVIERRPEVARLLGITANLYVLWAMVALEKAPPADEIADKYVEMMGQVYGLMRDPGANMGSAGPDVVKYYKGLRGVSTDLDHRQRRLDALKGYLL